MSDPFLSSSSEPSFSQSSAELSSQSSVQSLFESVFYEVTDSSNSQVSQVSSPSDLSFPLDNHDYILLDLVLPAPAPHSYIQESDLPAILTEKSSGSFAAIPHCHTQRAETGYLPASWRHFCVQDSQPGDNFVPQTDARECQSIRPIMWTVWEWAPPLPLRNLVCWILPPFST